MATVGRRKRKRVKGAGRAVGVKPHTRSPRGPNGGKGIVRVDPYQRGTATKQKKDRKRGGGKRSRS